MRVSTEGVGREENSAFEVTHDGRKLVWLLWLLVCHVVLSLPTHSTWREAHVTDDSIRSVIYIGL